MTPAHYKAARKALGWTHKELAKALGISSRHSHRFESGDTPIRESAARLLRAMVRLRLTGSKQSFVDFVNEL
jgi:transcriptional regulator with XRE-family HTH domain